MPMQSSSVSSAGHRIEVSRLLMSQAFRSDDNVLIRASDAPSKTITSESKVSAFPSALRSKRSAVRTLTRDDHKTEAVIAQTCPSCGREEMRYYTLQLRSADEGSTVFFSCDCGHK